MEYVWAFLIGGALCAIAQGVLDLTPLTAAETMVLFVILGIIASAFGLYQPLVKWAGAGASVPLSGFGNVLVQGIFQELHKFGPIGLMTGGLTASAAGITMAVLFGSLAALAFRPKG